MEKKSCQNRECPYLERIILAEKTAQDTAKKLDDGFKKIEKKIDGFILRVDKSYVNRDQFLPVKIIAYGFVGLILVSVFSSILSKSIS